MKRLSLLGIACLLLGLVLAGCGGNENVATPVSTLERTCVVWRSMR